MIDIPKNLIMWYFCAIALSFLALSACAKSASNARCLRSVATRTSAASFSQITHPFSSFEMAISTVHPFNLTLANNLLVCLNAALIFCTPGKLLFKSSSLACGRLYLLVCFLGRCLFVCDFEVEASLIPLFEAYDCIFDGPILGSCREVSCFKMLVQR